MFSLLDHRDVNTQRLASRLFSFQKYRFIRAFTNGWFFDSRIERFKKASLSTSRYKILPYFLLAQYARISLEVTFL